MVLRTTFFLLFLSILHIIFFHYLPFKPFLKRSEAWKISIWPFWNVQKHGKSPFGLSETFRSVKNFILAFLKCSEAWKTSFWPFWNVRKREKLHFDLSEMFRSMKNFFLVFLKCSEAWKTSFWSFWNVQKREKLLFGLSEMLRSMKNHYVIYFSAWDNMFFMWCCSWFVVFIV